MVALGELWGTQQWEDGVCVSLPTCPQTGAQGQIGFHAYLHCLHYILKKIIFSISVSACVSVHSSVYLFLSID